MGISRVSDDATDLYVLWMKWVWRWRFLIQFRIGVFKTCTVVLTNLEWREAGCWSDYFLSVCAHTRLPSLGIVFA